MFIVLSGYAPFSSETNDIDELFDQILSGKVEFNEEYWSDISIEAKDLILMMLNIDIECRYTAEQVINHSWIKVGYLHNSFYFIFFFKEQNLKKKILNFSFFLSSNSNLTSFCSKPERHKHIYIRREFKASFTFWTLCLSKWS